MRRKKFLNLSKILSCTAGTKERLNQVNKIKNNFIELFLRNLFLFLQ